LPADGFVLSFWAFRPTGRFIVEVADSEEGLDAIGLIQLRETMALSHQKGREGGNVSIQRAWQFTGGNSEKYTKTDSSLVATYFLPS
jgi:hypothetical protein